MASLAQLRDNIIAVADRGKQTRARSYSFTLIEFWIRSTRNFLITKDIEKMSQMLPTFEQDLGCLTLEEVDQSECPDYIWGEDVKKVVIPKLLDIDGNRALTFFGLVDKRTRIYVAPGNYGSLDDYQRFKPKKPRNGYLIGQTIYVKGPGVDKLCAVNVRGVFEDPTLVSYFDEQGQEHCYDKEKTPYPIPTDLEGTMNELIFKNYLLPFANAPRDKVNDEVDKQLV